MSEAVSQILSTLGGLSTSERAELAHALFASLGPDDPGVEQAWDNELKRRVARIRSGQATGRLASDFIEELRRERPSSPSSSIPRPRTNSGPPSPSTTSSARDSGATSGRRSLNGWSGSA